MKITGLLFKTRSASRGMIDLNNGGLSPSLRIATEALVAAGGKNKKNRRAFCARRLLVQIVLSYANPRETNVGSSIDAVVASP